MSFAISHKNKVWKFPFEGIEQMNLITDSIGKPQIEIMLATADKANELIQICQFNERNSKYFQFGFCSSKEKQLILWGPGPHMQLLDVLQTAIVSNRLNTVRE